MLQGSTSFRLTVPLSRLNGRFAHLSGRFLQIIAKRQVTNLYHMHNMSNSKDNIFRGWLTILTM